MSNNSYGFNVKPSAPEYNQPPPPYSSTSTYSPNVASAGSIGNQRVDLNEAFRQIKGKYEIGSEFGDKLQMLSGYKIVFIFDDSGSMNSVLQDSPLNQPNSLKATRWDELKYFANISIEIASIFDPTGCDVYFLNKPPVKGVNLTNLADFLNVFHSKPAGYTPLTQVLTQVLNENYNLVKNERKMLVVIVTDGEPTDYQGNVCINEFRTCLARRALIDRTYITIVACTDDDSSIDYLNRWDREIKHLDVVDDFRNEREEIRKIRGRNYRFTYGDYVVKSLVGSIDPTLDQLDERKKSTCAIV